MLRHVFKIYIPSMKQTIKSYPRMAQYPKDVKRRAYEPSLMELQAPNIYSN